MSVICHQNLFLGLGQVEIMHIRLHIFTSSLLFIIISWYNQGLVKLNLVKAGSKLGKADKTPWSNQFLCSKPA